MLFKMKKHNVFKSLALILPFLFLMLAEGCYYFRINKSTGPANEVIQKSQADQKYLILHLGDKAWHLSNIVVKGDSISGRALPLNGHDY